MSAALRQIAQIDNDKTSHPYREVLQVEATNIDEFQIRYSAGSAEHSFIVAGENLREFVAHVSDLLDLESERMLDFVEGTNG